MQSPGLSLIVFPWTKHTCIYIYLPHMILWQRFWLDELSCTFPRTLCKSQYWWVVVSQLNFALSFFFFIGNYFVYVTGIKVLAPRPQRKWFGKLVRGDWCIKTNAITDYLSQSNYWVLTRRESLRERARERERGDSPCAISIFSKI